MLRLGTELWSRTTIPFPRQKRQLSFWHDSCKNQENDE